MIKRTSTSTEMAVKALPKEEKTWEQIVPKHYSARQPNLTIFSIFLKMLRIDLEVF